MKAAQIKCVLGRKKGRKKAEEDVEARRVHGWWDFVQHEQTGPGSSHSGRFIPSLWPRRKIDDLHQFIAFCFKSAN